MKTMQVKIFGQAYTLRADMEEDRVRRVAELVDSRMREVAENSPSASALQIAILAALDIASEKCGQEETTASDGRVLAEVERRAAAMIARVESVAPGLLTN